MRARRLLGAGVALWLAAGAASAQIASVTTPRLPPRADGPSAAVAPSATANPAAAYATSAQAAPAALAGPVPERAPAGSCRAMPSPDRGSIALVSGAGQLPRDHVPLGEFRSQHVVHSADGRWAVALVKLRGAPQFAALSFDLAQCRLERSVDLDAAGDDVRFDADDVAVVHTAAGDRRVPLKDGRVR